MGMERRLAVHETLGLRFGFSFGQVEGNGLR